ncbi:unnamed protein product [Arabis nemorensis]|uniref:Uncharacterized protein n=1 Tax=Arabis nemorensis TaxID=586526 RepID=A0A565B9S1_9BRAS|nr:unnamed protein product [Arabis nemorensis]
MLDVRGFVHAIHLVMVEVVPSLLRHVPPGGFLIPDSEPNVEKDGDNDVENEPADDSGIAKLRITPFHAINLHESNNA